VDKKMSTPQWIEEDIIQEPKVKQSGKWIEEDLPSSPVERDHAKIKEKYGEMIANEVATSIPKEEFDKLGFHEKAAYLKEKQEAQNIMAHGEFGKAALSGLTFGATKNIEALKPLEVEELNHVNAIQAAGEIAGSAYPLHKLINIFKGPVTKMIGTSNVLQRQAGSLATMFAAGAATKGLETVAKGEIPSPTELLEHGGEWALLDAALQTLGLIGRFGKALVTKAETTGLNRKELINLTKAGLAEAGVPLTDVQRASVAALEILEGIPDDAARAAATRLAGQASEKAAISELAEQTLKQYEVTPKDLGTKKVTNQSFERLEKLAPAEAKVYQPGEIDIRKSSKSFFSRMIDARIEAQSPRASSAAELGETIKSDIETQKKVLQEEYAPLYQKAEAAATKILTKPKNTINQSKSIIDKIDSLFTEYPGAQEVRAKLVNVLRDAGYTTIKGVKGFAIEQEVQVSKLIDVKKILNKTINFESIEPHIKDELKKIVGTLNQDIRIGLAKNPEALAAFELAEEAHANMAKKYGKVSKIRTEKKPEKITKALNEPSVVADLKETMSPKQFAKVEREILEGLKEKEYEAAKKQYREIGKNLSKENQKLAKEIIESKNPHNPEARKGLIKEAITDDVSYALTKGTRPEKTLDLWKTTKGQKLVRDAFEGSPNKKEVLKYLENQSFADMVESVSKDGTLDLKKLETFIKDPATRANIESMGGKDAVHFFEYMEAKVNNLKETAETLLKLPTAKATQKGKDILNKATEHAKKKSKEYKVGQERLKPKTTAEERAAHKELTEGQIERGKKILENMAKKDYPVQAKINEWNDYVKEMLGFASKGTLTIIGISKLGAVLGIGSTVASVLGFRVMKNFVTNPHVRRSFNKASQKGIDPFSFLLLWNEFSDEAIK
jgi:hypothetical protein